MLIWQPPVPDLSFTKISTYGPNVKKTDSSDIIDMKFKISFDERKEYMRNMIITKANHKVIY